MSSRICARTIAGAFAAAIALTQAIGAQPSTVSIPPSPGFAADGRVAPGATDRYEVFLATGQFADFVVRLSVDLEALTMTLTDPAGAIVRRIDRSTTSTGEKHLTFVADVSGSYVLALSVPPQAVAATPYRLSMPHLGGATDIDRTRATALIEYLEGERLTGARTGDGYRSAIPRYRAAAALWSTNGDRAEESQALHRLAQQQNNLAQYAAAIETGERARTIRHELGDARGEGTSLQNLGNVYYNQANYTMALQCWEQALPLRRASNDRGGEAVTLSSIGVVYQSRGDTQRALEYYAQAIPLWRAVGDREGEALGLHNQGTAYRFLGESQQALDLLEQALRLRRAAGDRAGTAQTLSQIANVHNSLGDFDKAVEAYEEALPLRRAAGDRRGEGYTLSGLGTLWEGHHDWSRALEHHTAAKDIFQAIGDHDGEAGALFYSGRTWLKLGDPQRALELLTSAKALFSAEGNRRFAAAVTASMAEAAALTGDTETAISRYTEAVSVLHGFRDRAAETAALVGLAAVERQTGRFDDARAHAKAALDLVESVRSSVDSPESRASFLSAQQSVYSLTIDLDMQLDVREPGHGHAGDALVVSERARARNLLDSLGGAREKITGGVAPELLAAEQTVRTRLAQADDRLTRALSATSAKPEGIATAEREANAVVDEWHALQRKIQAGNPQYAALTQPSPLDVAGIQRLLDADTVLVEYALGPERSYAWIVTRRTVTSVPLQARGRIEEAARRCYDLLAGGARRETRLQTQRALEAVAALVLAPVARTLSARRVVIVPDGALQYVPFGALPIGSVSFIARHEVVMLPSASTLDALRRAGRRSTAPDRGLAVFADPVLRADDPRLAQVAKEMDMPPAPPNDLQRAATESGVATFDRLPFTRTEARGIVAFAPRAATRVALDFDATRTAAIEELSRSRTIHFATHALLNSRHPELSGIVLSLVDRDARPVDGFLRLHEIYNLPLTADLVVLSACRTALGKEVRGEGLVGLTRGFMYAGAAAVVASLWDVRDRATADLMTRFYRAMLRDGLRPAAALRAAQVSMSRDPRWSAPANWAGFTIQGDWQ